MANITMTYGTYNFKPVPTINMNRETIRRGDGSHIGYTYKVNIEGKLTPLPSGDGGLAAIDLLQDTMRSGLNEDGKLFLIQCGGSDILRTYPKVNSLVFNKTSDNWVFTSDYNIELEFNDEPVTTSGLGDRADLAPPYVKDTKESWSIEVLDDVSYYDFNLSSGKDTAPYKLKLSHNVSAVGIRHYTSSGLDSEAWQQARRWVIPQLGYDSQQLSASGVLNLSSGLFAPYNHTRTQTIDEDTGSFAVQENWIVISSGVSGVIGNAIEDFNINVKTAAENAITTVSIDGSIQGLEQRVYGSNPGDFSITTTKYNAASGYWNSVQSRLVPRLNLFVGSLSRPLNTNAVNFSTGHNPGKGTITYNAEYNNRPYNCVSGALTENISIADDIGGDVFAEIVVLGRAAGPILQDIGTKKSNSRSVSVDVVMPPYTGCPSTPSGVSYIISASPSSAVGTLISSFETELETNHSQVFKEKDSSTWDYKSGRYTRNVTWVYSDC